MRRVNHVENIQFWHTTKGPRFFVAVGLRLSVVITEIEFKSKFRHLELILFISVLQQPQMVLTHQLAGDRAEIASMQI